MQRIIELQIKTLVADYVQTDCGELSLISVIWMGHFSTVSEHKPSEIWEDFLFWLIVKDEADK